jgi:hypothetical protein
MFRIMSCVHLDQNEPIRSIRIRAERTFPAPGHPLIKKIQFTQRGCAQKSSQTKSPEKDQILLSFSPSFPSITLHRLQRLWFSQPALVQSWSIPDIFGSPTYHCTLLSLLPHFTNQTPESDVAPAGLPTTLWFESADNPSALSSCDYWTACQIISFCFYTCMRCG